MKSKYVIRSGSERLNLFAFGREEISQQAKWGPGKRDLYIVQYVLNGKGFYNGRPVEKGQGFLMRPMETGEYHSSEEEPWQYFFLLFSGTESETVCQRYLRPDENGIFTYSFRRALSEYAEELLAQKNETETVSAEIGFSVFFRLLAFHSAEDRSFDGNRYVEDAKNYIRLNYHRPLSVPEIAASLNINDRYLYNLFVKYASLSPKQYLNKVRLRNAAKLLQEGNGSVTDVATSVGFHDVLTFSRFFTKHMGMSPTAYRKNNPSQP